MRLVKHLAALAALASPGAAAAQDAHPNLRSGETLLEVEAEGVHRSRPDIMSVSAGVGSVGRTAAEALAASSAGAERVLARVRSLGVAPQDIRTNELAVRPTYAQDRDGNEQPRILGYTASNRVTLRLRDLSRAGAIISAAFEAGANMVEGPRFELSNGRPAVLAAQGDAVRRAREEADNYAAALGMRVARVLRVSERGRNRSDGGEIVVTGSRITAVPLEPGEVETEVRVWVDFALAPR